MQHLKTLLIQVAIDPDRLEMYNLSAAMGPKWMEICNEFTEKIRKLGPSPIWWADRDREKRSQPE